MKALIQHHIARAESGVEYNALRDCHVHGIDSIVLHDEPGNRVRLFFAGYQHKLYQNKPDGNYTDSLAVHPHHCDIRLVRLFGDVTNYRMAMVPRGNGPWREFEYRSAIKTGEAGQLIPTGNSAELYVLSDDSLCNAGTLMKAWELHTIHVDHGFRAAWLVIEGREDPHYRSVCWSKAEAHDMDGLYQPMSGAEVAGVLRTVADQMK